MPPRWIKWKLTVNQGLPLLTWLLREFALTREPGAVLASPDEEPGRLLVQKWSVMTVRKRPAILGAG